MKFTSIFVFSVLPLAAQNVYLFSLDGLGNEIVTKDPVNVQLRALHKVIASGVKADGMQAAFPSSTADSHAALFTGCYGDVSQITANDMPVLPRADHTFTERANGYRANQLAAEPLWVAAARQNVRTVAYQVTQAIPFGPNNTQPGALVFNSYQTRSFAPHTALRAKDVTFEPVAGWDPTLPNSSNVRRGFRWTSGQVTFYGAIVDNAIWVATSKKGRHNRLRITPTGTEGEPPLNRTLARHFSSPLMLQSPTPAAVYFRLFELAADGADFLLYQSPVQEIGLQDGSAAADALRAELLRKAGGTIPNGATRLLDSGAFGSVNLAGTDDTAIRRYLETVELAVRQNLRQTRFLVRQVRPRLTIGYLPFPDEFDHEWLAQARQNMKLAVRAREWGYQAVDAWIGGIESLAGKSDLMFVSDHGMAPITDAISVNAALRRAGLAGQVSYVYNSVLLNTTDWKGGTITPAQKPDILARVRKALDNPVFTAFIDPEKDGDKYGIRCPACSDLYFDLAPGWRVGDGAPRPGGAHGFLPTREDMLAICIGRGPKLPPGTAWPRMKSIDVAPTITGLLGIQPPKQARGHSVLPVR